MNSINGCLHFIYYSRVREDFAVKFVSRYKRRESESGRRKEKLVKNRKGKKITENRMYVVTLKSGTELHRGEKQQSLEL